MNHVRVKTAYLMAVQAWKASGRSMEAYREFTIARAKEIARRPKLSLSEEIQAAMTFKENKRKGWKSVIRDKRL